MEVLEVGPHETWMVGDDLEWEIAAPQPLGIYVIWHDGYGIRLPANSPIRPDCIIRRLSELLPQPNFSGCRPRGRIALVYRGQCGKRTDRSQRRSSSPY